MWQDVNYVPSEAVALDVKSGMCTLHGSPAPRFEFDA